MSTELTPEDEKSRVAQEAAPTSSSKRPSSERQDSNNGCEKNAQSDAPADESYKEELSSIAKFSILGPVTLAYFLWFLDLAVVSTATPKITSEFNSLSQIGWYGGAYQLGSSAFTPLTGKIFRSFSIKWSFIAFFLIFELGSLLCGVAQSSPMFIVGRGVAGVGSCGIATGALTIISAILKPRAQASFLGINQGIGQVGLAIGPVLGGAFTSYVSWRWCFYINLPIGGVALALFAFFRIPEPETKRPAKEVFATAIKSLDLQGFALVCPAAIMVLLGLQFGGNEYPWSSSVVIGLLVGGGVTFAVFLVWEYYQGDNAMIPFAMLRQRIIWSAAGNMCFVLSSILVADYYLAIYFQAIQDASPLLSGVHLLPTTLGLVLFTIISGVSIERFGYYLPWVVGGTTISAIGYGLLSLLSPHTSTGKWIGYQVFYGVGSGCSVAAAYIAIQNLVPARQIPTAMAIAIFCQNIGGAAFLILANAIFSNSLRHQLEQRAAEIKVAPDAIVNAGVRAIRELVSGKQLAAVLQAYSNSIDNVMYLGIGTSVAAWAFAWGLGFKDIRKEKELNAIESSTNAQKDTAEASANQEAESLTPVEK